MLHSFLQIWPTGENYNIHVVTTLKKSLLMFIFHNQLCWQFNCIYKTIWELVYHTWPPTLWSQTSILIVQFKKVIKFECANDLVNLRLAYIACIAAIPMQLPCACNACESQIYQITRTFKFLSVFFKFNSL